MFRVALVFAAALAFVSQVSALGFNFTGEATNITASQLLQVPSGGYISSCQQSCSSVNSTIQACGDTNDACLCTSDIAKGIEQCEQCMFEFLVAQNIPQTDPRVGTNVGLAAFSAACAASVNVTLPAIALTIPSTWDGPTDIILNTPETVVVVGIGAILGGSALLLLANL